MHKDDDWINVVCRIVAVLVGLGIAAHVVYYYVR